MLLARALYGEPAVLFIDEGTAQLDAEAERQVSAALASLGATRIVAAHRPQAIAAATRTLLVAGGRVRELAPADSAAA